MTIELRDVLSITRQIRGNDYDSGTHYLLGYLWANTPDKMPTFEVTCLHYEICGSTETFYTQEEFDLYGDDYTCAECYDQLEMFSHGWRDITADHMNTRMADAEMGDL